MANGFIVLKDRSCFAGRWTGYDEVLKIAIREIKAIDDKNELIEILGKRIPENDEEHEVEMGWGFINKKGEGVHRHLDLRGLSNEHYALFWRALQKRYGRLATLGEAYSFLNPDYLKSLLRMKKLSDKNGNPLDHSSWNVLANEDFEILSSNKEK
jgi:small nuclear ribonucleoprotein (snRNP)-like protein